MVGLCTMELQIPSSLSLKDKRQVLQGFIARIRNEFNVSVAEVDHQDSWQLATVAAVGCVERRSIPARPAGARGA